MKKTFIFIVLIFLSCDNRIKKSEDKIIIELYTANKMLPFDEGISIMKVGNFEDRDSLFRHRARFDTLNNSIIFAGKFEVDESDLSNEPVLTDKDILGFDFEKNHLLIDSTAIVKLENLEISNLWSRQFILTADNEPILKGYLYGIWSSSLVHDNFIFLSHYNNDFKGDTLGLQVGYMFAPPFSKNDGIHYDYTKNKAFYNAFRD
ncbi:MAG: hypothetical protein WBG46_01525 [Nonlabens sp.]